MGKDKKRVRIGQLQGYSLDRFMVKSTTSAQHEFPEHGTHESPEPGTNGSPIWCPCPEWIQELGLHLSVVHGNISKKQMLEIVNPYMLKCNVPQDLDFLECFAGKAEVTKALRRGGLKGFGFDEKYGNAQNVNTFTGLLNVFVLAKRVKPKGFCLLAPQCSAWLRFLDAANHCRCSANPFGDESQPDVFEANVTAMTVAFLVEWLHYRAVWTLVEQPADSIQGENCAMESAYKLVDSKRFHTWLGAFGNSIMKPTYLYTTLPQDIVNATLMKDKPKSGSKRKSTYQSKNGSTCGATDLEGTEAYTREFGDAVCSAVLQARESS